MEVRSAEPIPKLFRHTLVYESELARSVDPGHADEAVRPPPGGARPEFMDIRDAGVEVPRQEIQSHSLGQLEDLPQPHLSYSLQALRHATVPVSRGKLIPAAILD